jgi:hypothetical protein
MSAGRVVLIVSIVLYAACMFLGAFYVSLPDSVPGQRSFADGFGLLSRGWLGLDLGFEYVPWLANPLLFLAWILVLLRVRLVAVGSAMRALALGIAFLGVTTLDVSSDGPVEITGYGEGYWLWLASMAVALVAAMLSAKRPQTAKAEV